MGRLIEETTSKIYIYINFCTKFGSTTIIKFGSSDNVYVSLSILAQVLIIRYAHIHFGSSTKTDYYLSQGGYQKCTRLMGFSLGQASRDLAASSSSHRCQKKGRLDKAVRRRRKSDEKGSIPGDSFCLQCCVPAGPPVPHGVTLW